MKNSAIFGWLSIAAFVSAVNSGTDSFTCKPGGDEYSHTHKWPKVTLAKGLWRGAKVKYDIEHFESLLPKASCFLLFNHFYCFVNTVRRAEIDAFKNQLC